MRTICLSLVLSNSLILFAACGNSEEGPAANPGGSGGGGSTCGAEQTACGESCVDSSADPMNCGTCGVACTGEELCSLGSCVPLSEGCSLGRTACAGGCVDTSNSAQHCGACGQSCGAGQACENGGCTGSVAGTGGTPSTGSGGAGVGGGSGAGTGSGGQTGSGGSSEPLAQIFDECRFHFGTFRDFAAENSQIRNEIDFFIPGWMGTSNNFDQGYVCDDVKGVLAGKVPVVVAYVSAFYAKREGLNDCNVGQPDLCTYGSEIIKDDLQTIIGIYESYAEGYRDCLPEDYPTIFEMEPDWFQYTLDSQTDPMSPSEAGSIMSQYVQAVRAILPNAHFSMDISPWVPPSNGGDQGADWFSNFDLTPFSAINTSGGGTEADNNHIRSSNDMTWAGVNAVTNKPIIADTGYGVNGASEGHDYAWDNVSNINARIADGVVGVAQYNPDSNWGQTIANIRGQLDTPAHCP